MGECRQWPVRNYVAVETWPRGKASRIRPPLYRFALQRGCAHYQFWLQQHGLRLQCRVLFQQRERQARRAIANQAGSVDPRWSKARVENPRKQHCRSPRSRYPAESAIRPRAPPSSRPSRWGRCNRRRRRGDAASPVAASSQHNRSPLRRRRPCCRITMYSAGQSSWFAQRRWNPEARPVAVLTLGPPMCASLPRSLLPQGEWSPARLPPHHPRRRNFAARSLNLRSIST